MDGVRFTFGGALPLPLPIRLVGRRTPRKPLEFWWLVGRGRRPEAILEDGGEAADTASQSWGSLAFVLIVERCLFDGGSTHEDGGSPGDDSFPAWLLLDPCVGCDCLDL